MLWSINFCTVFMPHSVCMYVLFVCNYWAVIVNSFCYDKRMSTTYRNRGKRRWKMREWVEWVWTQRQPWWLSATPVTKTDGVPAAASSDAYQLRHPEWKTVTDHISAAAATVHAMKNSDGRLLIVVRTGRKRHRGVELYSIGSSCTCAVLSVAGCPV